MDGLVSASSMESAAVSLEDGSNVLFAVKRNKNDDQKLVKINHLEFQLQRLTLSHQCVAGRDYSQMHCVYHVDRWLFNTILTPKKRVMWENG